MGSLFGKEPGRQLQPQDWRSSQTQGPPAWLQPYLQAGMSAQGDILNQRLGGRGAPPTFADVTGGGYRSSYGPDTVSFSPIDFGPGAAGRYPSPLGPDTRGGGLGAGAGIGGGGGPGTGLLDIPLDYDSDRVRQLAGLGGQPAPQAARGGGGGRGAGRPRGGGGGGGGGGGRGGDPMAAQRQALAGMMMGRAAEPDPSIAAGQQFITALLGQNPNARPGGNRWSANPLMNMAGNQAAATFRHTARPESPVNQLIGQQMEEGNASAPYQTRFIDELFGRFNAPPPSTDIPVGSRYDLISQFGGSSPLFDIEAALK